MKSPLPVSDIPIIRITGGYKMNESISCPTCGGQCIYVVEYNDYFCYACNKYLDMEQGTNSSGVATPYPITAEGQPMKWNQPEKAQKKVWIIGNISGGVMLIFFLSIVILPAAMTAGGTEICMVLGLVVLLIPILLAGWWANMIYDNYLFAFTDTKIYIKKGVFNKQSTTIDYTRVQNVDYTQGIIERRFDVSTVKIETAGSAGAEGIIEGIGNPKILSDFIMASAVAVRSGTTGMNHDALTPGGVAPVLTNSSQLPDEILTEIRETNRLLREIVGKL